MYKETGRKYIQNNIPDKSYFFGNPNIYNEKTIRAAKKILQELNGLTMSDAYDALNITHDYISRCCRVTVKPQKEEKYK